MAKTLSTAIIIGLLIACGGGPASDSSDGSMFRANLQRTGVYSSKAVRELTELKWKFNTQGVFVTSPAVSKGVIYLASAGNNEDVGYLHAVDIETGKEKWNYKTARIDEIISAPSVTGGVAYFGCDNHLYAIDVQTEQEKWRYRAGGDVSSSPAIADNVAYFGSRDGYLYAVDIKTGQEKWKFKTETKSKMRWPVESSPAIADGVAFGSDDNQHLYAVDIHTGTQKWKFQTPGRVRHSSAIANGMVYSATSSFSHENNYLYAIDAQTGKEKWKFEVGQSERASSPTVYEGVVYATVENTRGTEYPYLFAIDALTGDLMWKYQTEDRGDSTSPSVADGCAGQRHSMHQA